MKSKNVPIMADDLSGSVPRHVKEPGACIQDWKIWLLGIWHNKSLLECGERILELPWHPRQVRRPVTACIWCLWCSLWCCCKWSPGRAIGTVDRCPDVTMVSRCAITTIPRPDDDDHQDYCVQKLWRTRIFIWSESLNSRLMNRLQDSICSPISFNTKQSRFGWWTPAPPDLDARGGHCECKLQNHQHWKLRNFSMEQSRFKS